jgi:4-hydroxy-tetrahydrodipicolinate synthase
MSSSAPTAITACITVFDEDELLDEDGQRQHYRRLVEAGVGVLVGSSGSGEGHTLTPDERRTLLRIAREELHGKVRFDVMGLEARTAGQMIELYELAKPYEFDVFHLYGLEVGHGNLPTGAELARFFRDVLDHVETPCYICNQPQMVGYTVPVDLVVELVRQYRCLVGVQDTGGDPRYLPSIASRVPERKLELFGIARHAMSTLTSGGHGFSLIEANIVPALCSSLVANFVEKNFEDAFRCYRQLLAVQDVFSGAAATKAILRSLGLPGGYVRRPRLDLNESEGSVLADRIRALGIAELAAR